MNKRALLLSTAISFFLGTAVYAQEPLLSGRITYAESLQTGNATSLKVRFGSGMLQLRAWDQESIRIECELDDADRATVEPKDQSVSISIPNAITLKSSRCALAYPAKLALEASGDNGQIQGQGFSAATSVSLKSGMIQLQLKPAQEFRFHFETGSGMSPMLPFGVKSSSNPNAPVLEIKTTNAMISFM